MKKWYETNYCDHRDWILDNIEILKLGYKEITLCLVIDFFNENKIETTYENLASKMGLSDAEIDSLIFDLSARRYMNISFEDSKMKFDLTPLFNQEFLNNEDDFRTLFNEFEEIFKRPLTSSEMEKISDFLKTYAKEDILDALRNADAYQKVSIPYIETILINKCNNG